MEAGEIAILNVSAGDTKLSFDPKNKAEARRAATVVADMLGFCILVEAGRDEKGPLYRRVQRFDPKTAEYIIAGDPPDQEAVPNVKSPSGTTPAAPGLAVKAERAQQRASRQAHPAPSQSRQLRAVRAQDSFHPLRERLGQLGRKVGEWAGLPVPIEGERLIVAPQMPFAGLFDRPEPANPEVEGWRIRNSWWCRKWRATVLIVEGPNGEIRGMFEPAFHHIGHDLTTMGASVAWGLEQEQRALQLLGTMIRHHAMKHYVLTGMFLEQSPRSGLVYVFRRLKPTVALKMSGDPQDSPRILASLCMHPIAYYAGSWAGAMCPTDDVIAHLTMMRGDEHLFWKRCSQHPPYRPEVGL